MKEFKLGDHVVVEKCYHRNGVKPHPSSVDKNRYNLIDCNSRGAWCGKRKIYTQGYSESDDYGYCFIPVNYEIVHLVAISTQRTVYVPDDYISALSL